MEMRNFKDRGGWQSQHQWDYPRNNFLDQQISLFGSNSDIGNSWKFKPIISREGLYPQWNEHSVPSLNRNPQWPLVGNKSPWPKAENRIPWLPASEDQWTPRQDLRELSNGFKQHSDPTFHSYSMYSRNSESNQGILAPTSYPYMDYSHQRPRRERRSERESRKNYEHHSRNRRPSFYELDKKRWQNTWAREAAESVKEEKPSKLKEEPPSTVSGPRVEIQYCNKKCRASQLHEACSTGNVEKVQEILDQPTVELEARDNIFWETPLMWAARLGNLEIIEAMYDKGAIPWMSNKDGATLLHLGVMSGDAEVVKYIMETIKVYIDHQDKSGKTALMVAAERANLDLVEYLIDSGAKTDLRSKNGANILLLAVESGSVELVKYLLDNTELAHNINCVNAYEHTPLMLAASAGFLEICCLLIQNGANCNVVDPNGRTPLHAAAEKGYSEVIDCLLEQNLILNNQDTRGRTPVHVALHNNCIPIAISLLKKGASLNIPDRKGRTVLHVAAEYGQMEIFHYMEGCNSNGDYKARTKVCWYTPVHCAAKAGHVDVVKWVINHGIDPNITDRDFNTSLHAAALEGHLELVKYLIDAKANVNQRNKGGETPLHIAAMWNHLSVVEYLCENSADVNIRDTWGQTALQVAQKGNCSDAVKYLELKQAPKSCT